MVPTGPHDRPSSQTSSTNLRCAVVSLNRNDGFVLKSWTGNCAYFDANGTYLGMLPATLPDDPDDWVTGDTIYVKCLKAQPTQMASVRISVNRIGDFGGKRPVISELSDHAFRFNPSTCSGGDHPSERSDAGHGFMYQLLGFWSSFFVFCAWTLP